VILKHVTQSSHYFYLLFYFMVYLITLSSATLHQIVGCKMNEGKDDKGNSCGQVRRITPTSATVIWQAWKTLFKDSC
jgi:hypothetical protein